jgi:hypothetical protein
VNLLDRLFLSKRAAVKLNARDWGSLTANLIFIVENTDPSSENSRDLRRIVREVHKQLGVEHIMDQFLVPEKSEVEQ